MDGFKELRSLEPGVFGRTMLVQRKGAPNTFVMRYLTSPDVSTVNKLLHQVFLMRGFDHPNVIKYHDVFLEQEGTQFVLLLLMDYYVDGNLTNVINSHTIQDPTPIAYLLSLLSQITNGVAFLHSKGLAHGDLKPTNILLAANKKRAIVADFGVAGPAVKGRAVPGVPAYMAPEQAAGRDAGAADLWALGCIALDLMLPGRPPKILYAEALERGEVALHTELRGALDKQGCWPADLLDLALALLSVDPGQRPEASDAYYQLRSLSNNYCPDTVPLITTTAQEYQPRMKDYYGMRQDSLVFNDGTFPNRLERTPVKGSRGGLEVLQVLLELGLEEQQQGRRTSLSLSKPRSSSIDYRAPRTAPDRPPSTAKGRSAPITIPDVVVTASAADTPSSGHGTSSFGTTNSARTPPSGSDPVKAVPFGNNLSSPVKGPFQFPAPTFFSPTARSVGPAAVLQQRSRSMDVGRFTLPGDYSSPVSASPSPRATSEGATPTLLPLAATSPPPITETALYPRSPGGAVLPRAAPHPLGLSARDGFVAAKAGSRGDGTPNHHSPGHAVVYSAAPAAYSALYHSSTVRTASGGYP
eukprot:EG_transcript_7755